MEIIAQNIVSGILVGALYGLAALGLSLVFGVLKILNDNSNAALPEALHFHIFNPVRT